MTLPILLAYHCLTKLIHLWMVAVVLPIVGIQLDTREVIYTMKTKAQLLLINDQDRRAFSFLYQVDCGGRSHECDFGATNYYLEI